MKRTILAEKFVIKITRFLVFAAVRTVLHWPTPAILMPGTDPWYAPRYSSALWRRTVPIRPAGIALAVLCRCVRAGLPASNSKSVVS
ncbi:MAG: hypothetical protein KBG15_14655, partial [Kofleriaceae bacterium]|nr:hypothetical protein [Kofleriaceae bacterium]